MDAPQELLPSEEIRRRIAEKAALIAEFTARNIKPTALPTDVGNEVPSAVVSGTLTRRMTVDGRKLAGLATRARRLETRAALAEEKANASKIAAREARASLDAYMRENGLL